MSDFIMVLRCWDASVVDNPNTLSNYMGFAPQLSSNSGIIITFAFAFYACVVVFSTRKMFARSRNVQQNFIIKLMFIEVSNSKFV